ncbi:MAG: hypothetical protein J7J51_04100 [Candidatus Omnitrophica bacterium]|nr:hypothetical protein [Candidatus Omnitrophota bacterium]
MGTVLFAILCLVGKIDTPYDVVFLCFLISLDSLVATQVISLLGARKK